MFFPNPCPQAQSDIASAKEMHECLLGFIMLIEIDNIKLSDEFQSPKLMDTGNEKT